MAEKMGRRGSSDAVAPLALDRRAFMKFVAFAGATACAPISLSGCGKDEGGHQTTFRVRVRRPEDLLYLDISLINLVVQGSDTLVRLDPKQDGFIAFDLPPQHIMERVLRYENAEDEALAAPLASMIAGPTRLVFRMPKEAASAPWSLEPLLEAVQAWELSVSDHAAPRADAAPSGGGPPGTTLAGSEVITAKPIDRLAIDRVRAPQDYAAAAAAHRTRQTTTLAVEATDTTPPVNPAPIDQLAAPSVPGVPERPASYQTAIELPTRLLISPHRHVRFLHPAAPETSSKGRVALWHTRMVPLGKNGAPDPSNAYASTIRGLWTRGPGFDPENPALKSGSDPFPNPLTPTVRASIVHQSSNYEGLFENGKHVPPEPVQVERLLLSSLGAWFDAQGDWSPKTGIDLLRWLQQTTLGRDHYVEYAQLGYLYPYGHDAILVTVSQREIRKAPLAGGPKVAAL